MKELQNRIQQMLREKKTHSRAVALITALSLLMMIIVPDLSVIPGVAMTLNQTAATPLVSAAESVIPPGAYDLSADITKLLITSISGGTKKENENVIEANKGADSVSFKVSAEFSIYDPSHDQVDTHKPYVYLTIPKDQLDILNLGSANTANSEDSTQAWREYLNKKGITDSIVNGTMTIYPTGDDGYGHVLLTFTEDYLNYLKGTNGLIGGSLSFEAEVGRAKSQDGDRTVTIGSQEMKVEFEDKTPSVQKEGHQIQTDENGCPIIQWTITVNDLYEVNNYQVVDTMLKNALSFDCQYGVYTLNNGVLTPEVDYNEYSSFTITYTTKVTAQELKDKTEPFNVVNTVSIPEVENSEKTASVPITPDSQPKVQKSGTPDYEYNGDRSGETAGSHYIYWTVDVSRNYGISLEGCTLRDTLDSKLTDLEMLSAKDANGNTIELSDLFVSTTETQQWTFKSDIPYSRVNLLYRTKVTEKDAGVVTNQISIDNGTPSAPTVSYEKSAQHTSSKTGTYVIEENGNQINEYIEWKLVVDATVNPRSNETINGYTIYDSAFTAGKYEITNITAKNNNQNVTVDAANLLKAPDENHNVKVAASPTIDYLEITYRVAVADSDLSGERSSGSVTATNVYSVEGETRKTVTKEIPGLAGETSFTTNKIWSNADDPERNNTTATLTLQYRLDGSNSWADYNAYDSSYAYQQTVNANQNQSVVFQGLPAYQVDATGNRTAIYYRVVETVNVPAGTPDLYELTSSYSGNGNETDGIKGSTSNPTME